MVALVATMEHDELVREMALVERLTTQERLKLARKRRKDQLRLCLARDRDAGSEQQQQQRPAGETREQRRRARHDRIHFVDGVVLLEAASRNDVDEVRRLLESGVDPDSTNEDGLTALHQCCIDDSEAMMTVLLDHGANVDAEDSERWTPLHAAATCGHLHLVTQLVERGANLLAVNADGNMAYDICEHSAALDYIETQMARRGITQQLIEETRGQLEAEMLADLRQRPANRLEERVDQQATPLHVAAANGYLSVVEHLLQNHVAVGPQDQDDWQPIHAAACWGHLLVIELLYQHGADLTAKTRNGETAFDVCEDPEIRERLEQLRTEQELRRTTDAQLSRVRRTQSTKHSIRRTSMRQKTLTPKKDVEEEARIRLGVEGSMKSALADSNHSLDKALLDLQDITIQIPDCINGNSIHPETDDSLAILASDARKTNGLQMNNNDRPDSTIPLEGSGSDPGKIDIHVHVTVNTGGERPPQGTLADLKQQRAQQRPPPGSGSGSGSTPPPLPAGELDTTGGGGGGGGQAVEEEEPQRMKFVSAVPSGGVTSEPPRESTGCCLIQ